MLATAGGGNEEQGFAGFRYGGGNGNDFSYRVLRKGIYARSRRSIRTGGISTTGEPRRAVSGWTGTRPDRAFTLQGDFYDGTGR